MADLPIPKKGEHPLAKHVKAIRDAMDGIDEYIGPTGTENTSEGIKKPFKSGVSPLGGEAK